MRKILSKYLLWLMGAALLIFLPQIAGASSVPLFNQIGIAIIFALAYNLLLGQSGLLSFGHAVYFGLGGFVTVQVMLWVNDKAFWLPTPLMPVVGALTGMISGWVLGYFSTRRHGTAFAMITLAIVELMSAGALMLNTLSGGEEGISAWRESWLWISFGSDTEVYYLILAWVVLSTVVLYGFTLTPLGRVTLAVRDNGERAQFIGYNTYLVRHIVFIISGTFAGVAGGLLAVNTELINYETMGLLDSAIVLINTFIGGAGFFSGPILGAILLTTMQMSLSNYTEAWLFYQGIIFILMVMFAPTGLAGILYVHAPVVKRGLMHRLLPAYAKGFLPLAVSAATLIFLVEFIFHWEVQFYSADPIVVFGITWEPASVWPWLVLGVGIAVGGGGMRYAIRVVRQQWDEVNALLKDTTQS